MSFVKKVKKQSSSLSILNCCCEKSSKIIEMGLKYTITLTLNHCKMHFRI